MNSSIIPVILCGGAGSRLWPASRESYPKQLVNLVGERSLLQETVLRVTGAGFAPPIVVTGHDYRFLIAEQLRALGVEARIIIEPGRRDSCAAVAAAASYAAAAGDGQMLLVLAADHAIPDTAAFQDHVQRGAVAAATGHVVTFGIKPTHAATGYGYIRPGEALDAAPGTFSIAGFFEKPDAETAARFVAEGLLWNSGNFMLRADAFLEELRRLAPPVHSAATAAVAQGCQDLDFFRLDADAFLRSPAISIDHAVMEKTARGAVVPADFVWSDIGSWAAVWELAPKDSYGNAVTGDVLLRDTRGAYVYSPDRLTAVLGVDDLVVITTRDAVLVAARGRAEEVKTLVQQLAASGRAEAREHLKTYRPWGSYEQIDLGPRYQAKRITVKPKARLSLQSHHHRSEHWVVVKGSARVTVDGTVSTVHENQSTYVPAGAVHRIENPGHIPLELIEVQTGSYLGEDDIVRYEDDYHRD